jgi:LemA protein
MAKDTSSQKGFSLFNRPWVIAGIVAAFIILVVVGGIISTYNGLVARDVAVDSAWSQVETVYQRRADLIPNLVATVKGASNFEQDTLTQITNARSAWTNARTPEDQVAAANGMESAISRLLLVSENYPTLQSNQNFLALQDELSSTENKVAVERQRYNQAVGDYNQKIRVFPSNVVAGMFGFDKRTFFEASQGAENAPVVDFE